MAKKPAKGHKSRSTAKPRSRSTKTAATARGRARAEKQRIRRGAERPLAERRRRFAKRKFAPADRVFHLVAAPETGQVGNDALTTCCQKPIGDVFAIAVSKDRFDPPVTNWCKGVPA